MKKILFFILISNFVVAQTDTNLIIHPTEILSIHNYYRKIYHVPKLQWSDTLEQSAQQWADYLAKKGQIHKSQTIYGENIYWSDHFVSWADVVKFWVNEQKYYYGKPVTADGLLKYQHFTQIIWKTTRYVGCGISKTKGGLYIYVCHYSPKGNIIGQKPY